MTKEIRKYQQTLPSFTKEKTVKAAFEPSKYVQPKVLRVASSCLMRTSWGATHLLRAGIWLALRSISALGSGKFEVIDRYDIIVTVPS